MYNVVVASHTLARFNIQPGQPISSEKYFSGAQEGYPYAYPQAAYNTIYLFVATMEVATAGLRKFYRIHSDRVTDIQEFPLGANSRAYGVLQGTPWVLASADGTTQRKLFDYTNGHNGDSNSVAATHTKPSTKNEMIFLSPEDARGYYVISDALNEPTRSLFTVKNTDGSQHLSYDLTTYLSHTIISLNWVYDTDLCLVASYINGFFLVDIMANTRALTLVPFPSGGGNTAVHAEYWISKIAFMASASDVDKSYIFKISSADQPCSDLCQTCDEIFRKKCLTCQPHSSLGSGATCTCDSRYYQAKLSFGRKQCIGCFSLCETCSGSASTDCLSCRDPNMDHLGDGSCRCKQGFYLSGTTCLPCHSSCTSCFGDGSERCSLCKQGFYLSGTSCLACHRSCTACYGDGSGRCSQCKAGFYLSGSSCLACQSGCSSCVEDGSGRCTHCKDGFYLSGASCLVCHSSCGSCNGGTDSECLSCSQGGFFLKESS